MFPGSFTRRLFSLRHVKGRASREVSFLVGWKEHQNEAEVECCSTRNPWRSGSAYDSSSQSLNP